MAAPLLTVKNLTVKLDSRMILRSLDFTVEDNEIVAVIGPNGAGKTVLFKALLGLVPYTGSVVWREGIRIGYIPQKLFVEHDLPLTTKEFFALKKPAVKLREIKEALVAVGYDPEKLDEKSDKNNVIYKNLGNLSGGELQRILVAWALLDKPNVLLFDEPTAGIDISSEATIYNLLHSLQVNQHLTILIISHELQIVYRYAKKVICLNKKIVCVGPPEDALDSKGLKELFGGEVGFYHHH